MQGYILNISKYKEEDIIVSILTPEKVLTLYRFYGARHSTVNLGYKIDFETESVVNISISRLRNIIHLAARWNGDRAKMLVWNQFIRLLYSHLRDIEAIDAFYFSLLEYAAQLIEKQNPRRVCIESYLYLLEHEGRLHQEPYCFICDESIGEENFSLARAFLPAHTHCIYGKRLDREKMIQLFETKKSTHLSDQEIEIIWNVMAEGL